MALLVIRNLAKVVVLHKLASLEQMVVIAITGSPAVGKSTISDLLLNMVQELESVAELAQQHLTVKENMMI